MDEALGGEVEVTRVGQSSRYEKQHVTSDKFITLW